MAENEEITDEKPCEECGRMWPVNQLKKTVTGVEAWPPVKLCRHCYRKELVRRGVENLTEEISSELSKVYLEEKVDLLEQIIEISEAKKNKYQRRIRRIRHKCLGKEFAEEVEEELSSSSSSSSSSSRSLDPYDDVVRCSKCAEVIEDTDIEEVNYNGLSYHILCFEKVIEGYKDRKKYNEYSR